MNNFMVCDKTMVPSLTMAERQVFGIGCSIFKIVGPVIVYGRRRVGKTTLLNEFCKNKESIFYSAEQSNHKLNLEKFSSLVFQFYQESNLEPFSSWTNALSYIDERQQGKKLVLVIGQLPIAFR